MTLSLTRDELIRSQNFIAGRWCDAADAALLPVLDPADDRPITRVPDSSAADARAAVDAAQAAFPAWRATPAKQRAQLLKRWNDLIVMHQEDLGRLISREQGKPLTEGRGEVLYAASYVEWFAEEATRAYGDMIPAPVSGRRMMSVKEPVGVVAAITPWNFPAAMIARKLAPAVVDVWLADPRVRKVTFTGSTPVGKHLARASADTLKKLSLELGGNAPFIVFDDADLDAAVDGLMAAKFRNGGQTCVCPNRVYVHSAVHDRFVEKLAARVAALKVGLASRDDSQIGPMINARAVAKIARHVDDAVAKGARLVTGGRRVRDAIADGPNYYAPTVLTGATRSMELSCEETFGPVVPVFRFDSEDEVIALANDTPFGLAAYFYTRDAARVWRVADALESGIVGINEGALAAEAAPFGGVKESGYGREGSRHGLDDYMHIKYLCQGGLAATGTSAH